MDRDMVGVGKTWWT